MIDPDAPVGREVAARRSLRAQFAIVRALGEARTLAEAAPRVLGAIAETLDWDVGALWTPDRAAGVLRCVGLWRAPTLDVDDFEVLSRRTSFAPGVGLPGRVWATGEPAWIADVSTDPNFPRAISVHGRLRGGAGFPIASGEEFRGVAEFFSRDERGPDDELLELMDAIGTQIGQFIEREEAEGEVRRGEAWKLAALESALDCVITMDHDGRIAEFNPAAERVFGYARSEVIGREMATLIIPPTLREAHRRGLARFLATGEGPAIGRRIELTGMRSDGAEFPIELAITRVDVPGPPLFTGYVRDISEQKNAEREAERAREVIRSVEAVTEAVLTDLPLDDLLRELLTRITILLRVDTAVILLYEPETDELVARAAKGLEEEIERGVRIPVGRGFAGRVAASREAVFVDDVDKIEIVNPLLREKGIRSLLGIPLLVGGSLTGVLHVGTVTQPRRFSAEDARTLRLIGDRIALAIEQARLYEAERAARSEAEAAEERLAFLAEASALLTASLDAERALERVAELGVARLADWSLVYVEEDGALRALASVHADPEKRGLVEELTRRSPFGPQQSSVVAGVLATGAGALVAHGAGPLEATALAPEDRQLLERVGFTAAIVVPLAARGRTVGALVFGSGDSGRRYTAADVALAEDLGRRAALAVVNARLFREAEERGQAARVIAAVGDGVFLLDGDGVVRLWNPAAEAITGVPAASVLGRAAEESIPGWRAVAARVPVSPAPATAGGTRSETVPLDIEGREIWLSISGVGFAEGTVYAFRDLTEERRLDELKTDFVATVSHELRTPLAAVYGAAMTLRRRDLSLEEDQRDRLLGVVSSEADRLARIVEDILWASRLDAGNVDVRIEPVEATSRAERVLEAARAHVPPNVQLTLAAPPGLPPLAADPDKVEQVLTNIVENAVKYSPEGGSVELRLEAREGAVRFAVRDEGLGIPASEQPRIFEKFYRLDPNLTRGVGGTGLGLYIARELVRRMDGRIWVVSNEGEGSTFYVELPVAERAADLVGPSLADRS